VRIAPRCNPGITASKNRSRPVGERRDVAAPIPPIGEVTARAGDGAAESAGGAAEGFGDAALLNAIAIVEVAALPNQNAGAPPRLCQGGSRAQPQRETSGSLSTAHCSLFLSNNAQKPSISPTFDRLHPHTTPRTPGKRPHIPPPIGLQKPNSQKRPPIPARFAPDSSACIKTRPCDPAHLPSRWPADSPTRRPAHSRPAIHLRNRVLVYSMSSPQVRRW